MIRRLVLALVAAAALAASGCGSGGGTDIDPGSGPLALLDLAAQKSDDAESYRLEYSSESTFRGQASSMKGTGTSNADSTRARMEFTMEEEGETFAGEMILIDEVMFMKPEGDEFGLPAGKQWLRMEDESLATPSLSPSQFVRFLRESGDVKVVGSEEVRGEKTTHFRGPLNMEKLAEETGEQAVELLGEVAKEAEVALDVWVTPDGLLARVAADIRVPEKGTGSLKMTGDFLAYGVPVDADEPPSEQVAEMSEVLGG
jgi:hypothetical protein